MQLFPTARHNRLMICACFGDIRSMGFGE